MLYISRLVFAFLIAAPAWSEQIQGRVSNSQGDPVEGARIAVSSVQGEGLTEAVTEADGSYSILGLQPGSYTLTVTTASADGTLSRQVAIPEGNRPVQANFQFQQAAASSSIAAEERNPNVFVYRIDLNDLRNRLTIVRGPDPTFVPQLSSDRNYFGAEFGAPLLSYEILQPRNLANAWRGTVSGLHQNSALNARNFFNVGPLLASRSTAYSMIGNGPLLSDKASLLIQYGQTLTSGAVNGNIQSPHLTGGASDRIPTSPDPQNRAVIASLLRAYPLEEPNLGGRRLNSNAARSIDSKDSLARLDYQWSDSSSLAFRYTINDYSEEPFQLVAGQNPQTDVRTQAAYISLTQTFSPQTVGRFSFNFDRTGAQLLPTKRFTDLFSSLNLKNVPDVDFLADQFTDLGPGTQFPRRRFQNRFQAIGDVSHTTGMHTFRAGWSTTRVQLNDLQSDNARGTLKFSSENLGCRDAQGNLVTSEVGNFLAGCPSSFTIAIGNFYRGFRNWEHFGYFEDQMRLSSTLSLTAGIRYELTTTPTEVNDLTEISYHTDKNNFAPRFGFAWNPGSGKTVIRGGYGISYAAILPVSYGMARFNLPQVQVFTVPGPDLLNPLGGSKQLPPTPFRFSPDLIPAYSHQYNFGIERALPWETTIRAAYLGSRSFHLLTQQVYNRARPSSTIANTTQTVQQRRPDQNFADINVIESNANAYYDAFQFSADKRVSNGLAFRAVYTFGKNIDTGGDFTNTATGVEVPPETGINSCESCDFVSDHKGISLFDTPNQLIFSYSYSIPVPNGSGLWSALFSGWQVSGTTIFQSGTPYHLHTGGDGPGLGNVDGNGQDRPNITNPALIGISTDDPDTSQRQLGAIKIGSDGGPLLDASGNTIPACERVPAGYLQCPYFDANIPLGGRGNIGWNTLRKDGTNNWNFAFGRTFPLPGGRERSLQFRTEFINFFNHAQFAKPGVQIASSTFGQITNTANKGRQVQFSLRLSF